MKQRILIFLLLLSLLLMACRLVDQAALPVGSPVDGQENPSPPPVSGGGGGDPQATVDIDSNFADVEGWGRLIGAPEAHLALQVQAGDLYSEYGFARLAGIVANNTGQWMGSVQIHILLYDAEGKLVREEAALYATLSQLAPGGQSSFALTRDLAKVAGEPVRYEIEAWGSPMLGTPPSAIVLLEASSSAPWQATIQNNGAAACEMPVAAVLLWQNGQPHAEEFVYGDRLEPGETQEITISESAEGEQAVYFVGCEDYIE